MKATCPHTAANTSKECQKQLYFQLLPCDPPPPMRLLSCRSAACPTASINQRAVLRHGTFGVLAAGQVAVPGLCGRHTPGACMRGNHDSPTKNPFGHKGG
jgi:hypothetical protein